jgi:hypothetical protein
MQCKHLLLELPTPVKMCRTVRKRDCDDLRVFHSYEGALRNLCIGKRSKSHWSLSVKSVSRLDAARLNQGEKMTFESVSLIQQLYRSEAVAFCIWLMPKN